jgi:peptide deformylase
MTVMMPRDGQTADPKSFPDLIYYPDPRLRKKSEPVAKITDEIRQRVKAMYPVMYAAKGIGLAAPQIGWNVRLFVMSVSGEPGDEVCLVNPEIVEEDGKHSMEEGCLSLPDIRGKIERPKKIKVRAAVISERDPSIDGQEVEIEADGLVGRCVQHELDHLDGILIIDRFSPAKKQAIKARLRELEDRFAEKAPH